MNSNIKKHLCCLLVPLVVNVVLPIACLAQGGENPPENPKDTLTDTAPNVVLGIDDVLDKAGGKLDAGAVAPPMPVAAMPVPLDEKDVLVIDSDEPAASDAGNAWEELKDEPGKTLISAGANFPVVVISSLNSKTAKVGDPVQARLKVDIRIGGRLIAKKGDMVYGHVFSARKARRMIQAEFSPHRWLRANGCIGIQFDEIVTDAQEHLPLVAIPAQRSRIVKNVNEGRVLGVNDNGEIVAPLSTQLKAQALHFAIRGAASAGGVFSLGIVPVTYGVVGAINPSFAFLHPVGKNVPHRRLKGFGMGVVSGLPGGFLVADTIIRGKEAEILPGDEFLAQFKQDFTGEASTSASLIPGASTRVKGQVLNPKVKKKQ